MESDAFDLHSAICLPPLQPATARAFAAAAALPLPPHAAVARFLRFVQPGQAPLCMQQVRVFSGGST